MKPVNDLIWGGQDNAAVTASCVYIPSVEDPQHPGWRPPARPPEPPTPLGCNEILPPS